MRQALAPSWRLCAVLAAVAAIALAAAAITPWREAFTVLFLSSIGGLSFCL